MVDNQQFKHIEKIRLTMEENNYLAGQPSLIAKIEESSFINDGRVSQLRWYFPKMAATDELVVLVHGGGYIAGSITTHDVMARKIANENQIDLVSFGYSLAPEYKFPSQVNDLIALLEHIKKLDTYKKIILLGDSAGGTIVAESLEKIITSQSDLKQIIVGQVLLYAALSFEFKTASIEKLSDHYFPSRPVLEENRDFYLNGLSDIADPLVSPLNREEFTDFPPTFVLVEELDPLRDEGLMLFKKIDGPLGNQKNNQLVDAKNVKHGFLQYFVQPENQEASKQTFEALKNFIKNVTK
ncbi:alpha/beta hydrolase family protein [Weissella oryzae SG25]|uniref:Alpha/beta hydrolase family protein n=1 Tax=Weissella oryzae (strain DSM 25784 / JCM 18191 / LMG 30913 / SG25) TaxID=1329250 RepID=A0A069CUR0_WEIOS|nr:alpha/beta hydrolase [Weissella oryzae]GAK31137.1 alpha/beta hydrolase family protein [Weissella oryzae SG25]